jgi:hypothetical protein
VTHTFTGVAANQILKLKEDEKDWTRIAPKK